MKKIIAFTLLSLSAICCEAGLFKNSVDLADLAEVPAEALVELEEAEFGVFRAQVGLNSAKAAERRAAGAVKAAERTLETEDQAPAAAKYDVEELAKTARKRQAEYDDAKRKAESRALGLAKLEQQWRRLARASDR